MEERWIYLKEKSNTSSVSSDSEGISSRGGWVGGESFSLHRLRRRFSIVTVCWSSQNSASRLPELLIWPPTTAGGRCFCCPLKRFESGETKSNWETGRRELTGLEAEIRLSCECTNIVKGAQTNQCTLEYIYRATRMQITNTLIGNSKVHN